MKSKPIYPQNNQIPDFKDRSSNNGISATVNFNLGVPHQQHFDGNSECAKNLQLQNKILQTSTLTATHTFFKQQFTYKKYI